MGWGRRNWFKVYLVESLPALVVPLVTLNLVNLALNLMVPQIVVLLGPAVTLGLIASNRRLMGRYFLNGSNKILYWGVLVLVFGTGIASLIYAL